MVLKFCHVNYIPKIIFDFFIGKNMDSNKKIKHQIF